MQDCKICDRHDHHTKRGVQAWEVRPLLRFKYDEDDHEPPHDKERCHYCRYLDKSCAQMFWGKTSKPLD